MSRPEHRHRRTYNRRIPTVAVVLASAACLLAAPSLASAGTYPMHQCAPGTPAVSPGWSVFGVNTNTSSVLWNTCSTGGAIGDSVASNEQAGAVTENGHMGSQVGLQIDVPGSAPDVTIDSITAEVIGSSVTGDDAWLGFTSGGQALPGAVELPYGGGSNYTASESWTLPQGARDFEANVTCSTDDSSPTCYFADSIAVPALSDITLTLIDNTPPAVTSVSGALASAAAAKSTVAGSQLLNFTGADADSGVRSAVLTLSPQGGGAPYTHTFDFSSQCSYDAWNACPLTQTVSGFAVNTSSLKDDSYAVSLAVTDAAGNVASDSLGTITTAGPPSIGVNGGSINGALRPPAPAHIANGDPCAGEALELAVNGKSKPPTVLYGKSVTVRGVLHCGAVPIRGARIAISTIGGPASAAIDTSAQTALDGSFSYSVPTGPDRELRFSYTAYSDDPGPAATATTAIVIRPRVTLKITPHRTSNRHTIYWRGTVTGGPYPVQGVTLDVEVQEGRSWKVFDQVVTNSKGQYRYSYRFHSTEESTTYTFRVTLPDTGAQGYPYTHGASNTDRVHVNP
jgi:hypothetical protein